MLCTDLPTVTLSGWDSSRAWQSLRPQTSNCPIKNQASEWWVRKPENQLFIGYNWKHFFKRFPILKSHSIAPSQVGRSGNVSPISVLYDWSSSQGVHDAQRLFVAKKKLSVIPFWCWGLSCVFFCKNMLHCIFVSGSSLAQNFKVMS